MQSVPDEELRSFLAKAGIEMATPSSNIGAQLSYRPGARRTIVVQFAETDNWEYVSEVLSAVLSIEDTWVLIARYGSVVQLGLANNAEGAAAVRFNGDENSTFVTFLRPDLKNPRTITRDLYAIGASGEILVTWDHHTFQDGLSVEFSDIARSSRLLTGLNALGAELEVYYADG